MKQTSQIYFLSSFGLLIALSLWGQGSHATLKWPGHKKKPKIKYQTTFGQCPSRSVGGLVLKLIKVFEERHSLRQVKNHLLKENLKERYFINTYRINFDPLRGLVKFKFQCPLPLMKVQVYKTSHFDSYETILTENGQFFDPTYEVLLREEKKLSYPLPYLAIPVSEINDNISLRIAETIREMSPLFRRKLSEVILNKKQELTVILSIEGRPSSVFLGEQDWKKKVGKLQRVVQFMKLKRKIPTIINLTNYDKVVVKFDSKF